MEERRFLSAEEFRHLQLVELDLLKEFDRVCRLHDIKYAMAGGTMLGAIRHKGFIPWDDDIDVAMTREEYEKFKKVSDALNPEICYIQDHLTDPFYRWGYSKIRRTGTTYVRLGQEHLKNKTGIFIDVFPMDDSPKSLCGEIFQDVFCYVCRKILWSEVGKIHAKGLKKWWFSLLSHIPTKQVFKWIHMVYEKKSRNDKPNRVRPLLFPAWGNHEVKKPLKERFNMPKDWFLNVAEYEFEGCRFYGMKDAEGFLKYIFDDYMTLPPEDKRDQHAPLSSIDFGKA